MTHQYPIQRVTLVTLGVRDLARSRAFYKALGWHPHSEQEGISFYQMNGAALALFGLNDLADDQDRPAEELHTGAMTLAQNYVTEEAVDQAFHAAVAAGATVIKTPQAVSWGGYSGYYADPDGHVWEVAMNPFWPLNADGSLTLP
jgi:predicted lactoylglutathione lyase